MPTGRSFVISVLIYLPFFSSLSVEFPRKDSHDYFYNEFFIISHTVLLKEKRTENEGFSTPNQKSQGKHRNKQTRKDQKRTRFLWADKCRQNTDANGRATRRGCPKKRYITKRLLLSRCMAKSLRLSGAERNACRSFYLTWHTTKCDFVFL